MQSAQKSVHPHRTEALHCWAIHNEYRLKVTFFEGLWLSIGQSVQSYLLKTESEPLQEILHCELSLGALQSSNTTPGSRTCSKPERRSTLKLHAKRYHELHGGFKLWGPSWLHWPLNATLHQLLTMLEQQTACIDKSLTELTAITAMDEVRH